MAAAKPKKGGLQDAPYNFPPPFERAVAYLSCTNPRFLARCAHELRPDLLSLRECQLALEAAQHMFRARGQGPEHVATTLQYLAAKREDGKLTQEDLASVSGLFDIYDGQTPPSADETEPQVVDVVRKRLRFEIAQAAVAEYNSEDWNKLRDLMRREEALGQGEGGVGIVGTTENLLAAMTRLRQMRRMPFGISGLDEALDGGVPNGTLTCFMAGPGGAKSMTMSHIAGQLSCLQLQVVYATLELPAEQIMARIGANQTGITINEVISGVADEELKLRLQAYAPLPVVVQDFAPHVTTVEVLQEWVKTTIRRLGRKVDVLIVDYADKLTSSGKVDDKSSYNDMRVVYEKLRIYCDEVGLLGITASQSRARDEKKGKVIDLEHVADSMHKARIVDQFITLNFDDETKEITFFLAKNRYGEGRKKAGPLPTVFACGQVAPIARGEVKLANVTRHNGPANTGIGISPLSQDPNLAVAGKAAEAAVVLGSEDVHNIYKTALSSEHDAPFNTADLEDAPF